VHDNRIEETLRSVLRREGDELTVNITAQELERRLALRGRARAGLRLSLLAAGLAVIAVGAIVAGGNGWFGGLSSGVGGQPVSTQAPEPSSAIASNEGSTRPSQSTVTDGSLPCEPVDPTVVAAPPDVVAGVVPGDSLGYGGTVIATEWNGRSSGSPGSWDGLSEALSPITVGPDQRIEISSDGCFQVVTAEALPAVTTPAADPSPAPIALAILGDSGGRVIDIDAPPTGGWTVRVRATFLTTDRSEAWSDILYRIVVPFHAPRLLMIQGSTTGEWAVAHCPNFQLASGASASDQCGAPYEPITGPTEPLSIAKGSSMDIQLAEAWRIEQARVVAVDADLVAAGSFAPEYSVALVDNGGLEILVRIDLDPGSWIVRVSLNARRDGDSFDAYYDFPLVVTN
jgi:hypothetical protein